MATKQEIFKQAMTICEAEGASEALVTGLTALLEPKKGGQSVDIESIVTRDENGEITHITCRYSNVSLPATSEYFPNDKASKANGLYTVSKQALAIKKAADKTLKASKEAITSDVLNEVIAPAEAKEMIANLTANIDYSTVGELTEEA